MTKKKRKARRKKLASIKTLKNRAAALWRDAILHDNKTPGGYCVICVEREAAQAHHVFPKDRYGFLMFDLRVGIPVCMPCHFAEKYDTMPAVAAWLRSGGSPQLMELLLAEKRARDVGKAPKEGKRWTRVELLNVIEALAQHGHAPRMVPLVEGKRLRGH